MQKAVTVLGLEGSVLRGIRLAETGKADSVEAQEAWELSPRPAEEDAPAGEIPDPQSDDGYGETEDGAAGGDSNPLADAFAAAAARFGTREFVLSLPLSKMLVEPLRIPAEDRENLQEEAEKAIARISPFPDEQYRVGVEIVAETDRAVYAIAAALPDAVSLEIGDAMELAKVRVTRTDATALGRLRTLWPKIVAGGGMDRRRLVLMDLDGGWDFIAMDGPAPVMLRGLGPVASPAELVRETMLGVIRCESAAGARDIGEVVLVSNGGAPDPEIAQKLADFGPVRVVETGEEDAFAGVEGVAARTAEDAALDITPETWNLALAESRFKKRLAVWLGIAGGAWAVAMAVLFGVPVFFGWMADRQKAASRRHHATYQRVKDTRDRVRLVQRYSDHARGALEMLKTVSDSLPDGVTLSQFQYRRGEYVRIYAEATQPTDVYAFKNRLDKAATDDGTPLFSGTTLSEIRQSRTGGHRFDIEAKFAQEDDDAPAPGKSGDSGKSGPAGRKGGR